MSQLSSLSAVGGPPAVEPNGRAAALTALTFVRSVRWGASASAAQGVRVNANRAGPNPYRATPGSRERRAKQGRPRDADAPDRTAHRGRLRRSVAVLRPGFLRDGSDAGRRRWQARGYTALQRPRGRRPSTRADRGGASS